MFSLFNKRLVLLISEISDPKLNKGSMVQLAS